MECRELTLDTHFLLHDFTFEVKAKMTHTLTLSRPHELTMWCILMIMAPRYKYKPLIVDAHLYIKISFITYVKIVEKQNVTKKEIKYEMTHELICGLFILFCVISNI